MLHTHTWKTPEGRGWNEMKWYMSCHVVTLACRVLSWHVGMGGFWLGHLAISDDESFAGTFSRRHRWVFVGPCHLCVHGPPAFTLWFRVSHTQQAARARFFEPEMVRNLVCCFHGVVLWHGTCCSNVCDALLAPTKTQGSFTAFSSIFTEEGWQKQITASEFPAVQQATNDRQKKAGNGMVLFPSVLGCDMEHGAEISVYMGHGCHQWGVVFF